MSVIRENEVEGVLPVGYELVTQAQKRLARWSKTHTKAGKPKARKRSSTLIDRRRRLATSAALARSDRAIVAAAQAALADPALQRYQAVVDELVEWCSESPAAEHERELVKGLPRKRLFLQGLRMLRQLLDEQPVKPPKGKGKPRGEGKPKARPFHYQNADQVRTMVRIGKLHRADGLWMLGGGGGHAAGLIQ